MTSMFSNDDLVRAIERRRNQFLLETGCHLTHSQISYSAPANGRVSLSDSIIDIRRAAFLLSSIYYPLYRVDEYAANTLFIGWNSSSSQSHSYSFFLTPKPSLQLLPIGVAGTLDLITVNAPTDLLTSTGVSLNIPDDFSWIVKFGALADLLSRDGQSYDPFRASYCQQRWQQGLQLASSYSTIQAAYIGSNSVIPQSLYDLDTLDWNWQNMTGTPTDLITIGRNLIALHPVPTGSTTITLDILRNAPLPSADGDKINIGKEQFDIILDYATHLAMFKHGGDEFQATYPLLDRFMNLAMANNSRLLAEAGNYSIMNSLTRKNELDVPRLLAQ